MQSGYPEASLRFNKLLSENLKRDMVRKQRLVGKKPIDFPRFQLTVRQCTQTKEVEIRNLQFRNTQNEQTNIRLIRSRERLVNKLSPRAGDLPNPRTFLIRQMSEAEPQLTRQRALDIRAPFRVLKDEPRTLRRNFNDFNYDQNSRPVNRLEEPRVSMFFQDVNGNFEGDIRLNGTVRLDAILSQKMSYGSISSNSNGKGGLGEVISEGTVDSNQESDESLEYRPIIPLTSLGGKKASQIRDAYIMASPRRTQNASDLKRSDLLDLSKSGLKLTDSMTCHRSHWILRIEAILEASNMSKCDVEYYSHKGIERAPETNDQLELILRTLSVLRTDIHKFMPTN
jgi:hypothetical protein